MTKKTEFKLIRIISDTEFIMNGGTNDNVRTGDLFEVRDKDGEMITDLDGKVLGQIGGVKAELEVSQVYENFSILRSKYIEPSQTNSVAISATKSLGKLLNPIDNFGHYDHLNINISDMQPIVSKMPISKGDSLVYSGNTKEY